MLEFSMDDLKKAVHEAFVSGQESSKEWFEARLEIERKNAYARENLRIQAVLKGLIDGYKPHGLGVSAKLLQEALDAIRPQEGTNV